MNEIDMYLFFNDRTSEKIYKFSYFLIVSILITIYIIFMYKYQTYYTIKGKMINNQLEIKMNLKDAEYLKNNHYLLIDNKKFNYQINDVSKLYVDSNYHNYLYFYLKIDNLNNIDNYIYEIKIPKDNKILAMYVKDYL